MLKPSEKFLVISSDIGQTAAKQAQQFNDAVGLTGVIATKADASGKAGGALSACYTAKVPVAFIGTGEKVDDFEVFDAEKFVSRLLGFADIGGLVKKLKEAVEETDFNPEELMSGDYNLKTFYKQLEATKKMGPMKKVLEMMGIGNLPEDVASQSEEKMKKFKVIMDSMTDKEQENPELLKASRISRIAKGSGTTEADVRELIKQFDMGRKMIKKFKKGKTKNLQGMMKKFGMGRMGL
jgi:signal recognition particle subunit SRP54